MLSFFALTGTAGGGTTTGLGFSSNTETSGISFSSGNAAGVLTVTSATATGSGAVNSVMVDEISSTVSTSSSGAAVVSKAAGRGANTPAAKCLYRKNPNTHRKIISKIIKNNHRSLLPAGLASKSKFSFSIGHP